MERAAKQSFIQGAVILTGSTLLVKAIGALFKVPLMNILGGTGMAYFMTAYEVFNPIYALSVAGFPAAVSRLVSEYTARGRQRDARRTLKIASALFLAVGAVGFALLYFGGKVFCRAVGNPDAALAVQMLSPALVFGCLSAAVRGYYQGCQNMVPTAISQVVEAVAKLVLGIALSYGTFVWAMEGYARTGLVFGRAAASAAQAKQLALPYAAAGAVLGVALSTGVSMLYLFCQHKFGRHALPVKSAQGSARPASARHIARRLVQIALPICLGSFATSLTSVIDLFSVMNALERAAGRGADIICAMYGLQMSAADLPTFLYGCYTGMATTLYNLVPALTTTFGVSALPAVTAAYVGGDRRQLAQNAQSVFRVSAMMAVPAGLGIAAMARPILHLLYGGRQQEIAAVAPTLTVLGAAAVLLAFTTPVYSMLQAIGRADLPLKLMVVGGAIKLACNLVLVRDPRYNLLGASFGTLCCYLFIVIGAVALFLRQVGAPVHFWRAVLGPAFSGLICAVSARTAYSLLCHVFVSNISCVLGIAVGCGCYLLALLGTGSVQEEDLLALPGGQKLAAKLHRWGLLGSASKRAAHRPKAV